MTIAGELELEACAYAALQDSHVRLPAVMDRHAIRRRYVVPAMRVVEDENGSPEILHFHDGSSAERDPVDARIWREVERGDT